MSGRRLKFKTFLKEYCKYLTNSSDFRLSSFACGLENNARAEEAVFLYSLFLPNEKYFYKSLNNELKGKYEELLNEFRNYNDVEEMLSQSQNLSYDFQKVYKAYLNEVVSRSANQPLKVRYCKRLNELMQALNVSRYKVCKDNDLDVGNFYEFLKGDFSRMSLESCDKVYLYLSTYE